MSNRIDGLNKAGAAANAFIQDATAGKTGAIKLAEDSKKLLQEIDSLHKAGTITDAQYDKLKGNAQDMTNAAGASDGAAVWNEAVNSLITTINAAGETANPNAANNPEVDLGGDEGANFLANLRDGDKDFGKNPALAKYVEMEPADAAKAMKADGLHLFVGSKGESVVYSDKTRQTQGFDEAGKGVDVGGLNKKEVSKQMASIKDVKVGTLTLNFGVGNDGTPQKDTNGNVFGLAVKGS